MYYLDRQQGERFHNWAHRVFNRYEQIREPLVKKYKVRLDRYIIIEKCVTVERCYLYGKYETPYNFSKCLNLARSKLERNYPLMSKIVKNDEYPRSIVLVQQYIEDIKQYEVLKALDIKFSDKCYMHNDRNFFADHCKHNSKSCVKCLVPDPVMNDISINKKLKAFFPNISFSTVVKCKSTLNKEMCHKCLKTDFPARVIQYYWRQYKNKHQKWQDRVIYEFVNKMINYNINKGGLFHALTISKMMDVKTVSKMQSVINVYK